MIKEELHYQNGYKGEIFQKPHTNLHFITILNASGIPIHTTNIFDSRREALEAAHTWLQTNTPCPCGTPDCARPWAHGRLRPNGRIDYSS